LSAVEASWGQQSSVPSPATPLVASSDTTTRVPPSATSQSPVSEYTVSPEDNLEIEFMDVPELSRTYRVSAGGFLRLPLLPDPIAASGLSLDQLEHVIAAKYKEAGMLSNAIVTVSLKDSRLHSVLVTGEVGRPEPVQIYGSMHLLDALVQAGGLSQDAGDVAIVTRGETGERLDAAQGGPPKPAVLIASSNSFSLNIRHLMLTGDDVSNILLYPGDRVAVQRAELIYIMGAVGRPGGYVLNESRQNITVMKALAMAGDVSSVAKRSKITLLRRIPATSGEKREEIPVNYKGMVKGKVEDMRLVPDDILYVPESTSLKAFHTSMNTAVSVAQGGASWLIIYH
jgi:polysaccharide biosynthesis/export protein